jgi:hypothetical protein
MIAAVNAPALVENQWPPRVRGRPAAPEPKPSVEREYWVARLENRPFGHQRLRLGRLLPIFRTDGIACVFAELRAPATGSREA